MQLTRTLEEMRLDMARWHLDGKLIDGEYTKFLMLTHCVRSDYNVIRARIENEEKPLS